LKAFAISYDGRLLPGMKEKDMKRSSVENKDLAYTVRINGRVAAAFRRQSWAEDFANQAVEDYPDDTIEIENSTAP
jgi:hypothetical protein